MLSAANFCCLTALPHKTTHKGEKIQFQQKSKTFKTLQSDDTTTIAKILAAWDEGCRPLQNFPPKLVLQPLWDVHPIYNSCKKHFPTEISGPCRNIMFLKDLFAENVFSLHPISSSMCSLGTPPCCFALSRTLANSHSLGLFLAFCVQFLK